jgi:hypothetical protein
MSTPQKEAATLGTYIENINKLLNNKNILGTITIFFFTLERILMQYDLMYPAWFSVICAGAIIFVLFSKS